MPILSANSRAFDLHAVTEMAQFMFPGWSWEASSSWLAESGSETCSRREGGGQDPRHKAGSGSPPSWGLFTNTWGPWLWPGVSWHWLDHSAAEFPLASVRTDVLCSRLGKIQRSRASHILMGPFCVGWHPIAWVRNGPEARPQLRGDLPLAISRCTVWSWGSWLGPGHPTLDASGMPAWAWASDEGGGEQRSQHGDKETWARPGQREVRSKQLITHPGRRMREWSGTTWASLLGHTPRFHHLCLQNANQR